MKNRATALAAAFVTTAALSIPAIAPVQADAPNAPAASASVHTQAEKVIQYEHQWQETGYWCGPAATRVALTAAGDTTSQAQLAEELPTDENGTDHIGQVTDVLNAHGAGNYVTTELPSDPPTDAQEQQLWDDVVNTIDQDRAVVANIVAPPGNQPPGYPSDQTIYHYFTVVGYNSDTSQVKIADSAQFSEGEYWLDFHQLATLIPPKGYSALG